MSVRVARSRELVARGFAAAAVARVMQVSRQALYRAPTPRTPPQRRPSADPVERAIVDVAMDNQTDGYRMICAFVRRRLGVAVNRKRVLRVMRERKLIQRRRPLERRKRPGFFRVERPRQLWQLDLTSVWVAEHGWTYLLAIIDCCSREIVAWQLELRCRADEAIALIERAAALYAIEEGELGSARTTGPPSPPAASAPGSPSSGSVTAAVATAIPSRKPSSSPGSETQEREVCLNEYETLDDARQGIGGYVDRYHHRPHSGLNYRTPDEVRRTWEDLPERRKQAA